VVRFLRQTQRLEKASMRRRPEFGKRLSFPSATEMNSCLIAWRDDTSRRLSIISQKSLFGSPGESSDADYPQSSASAKVGESALDRNILRYLGGRTSRYAY